MGILEQIIGMRNQGISDEEIVGRLQERGITPQAINDALNQAEIKKAVSNEGISGPPAPSQYQGQEEYYPQQEQQYSPQEYSPQQQNYEPQYSGGGIDTSTIIEISEKVFLEKTQKMQKQLKEVVEFKALAESRIESVSERLKRIENMIDKLQVAILEKIGSYGRGLENVQKEMQMMQDSFGKVISPLIDGHGKKTTHESSSDEEESSSEEVKSRKSRK